MTVDLQIDALDDCFQPREDFVSAMARWYGRDVTWDDLPTVQFNIGQRIIDLVSQGGPESDLLIYKLAWLGTPLEKRPEIERKIAHLIRTANEWKIVEVGGLKHCTKRFSKSCKHTWKSTCKAAEKTWDKTCEIADKTCDAVAEFWDDNKEEILIGLAVAAAVAAVVVVTVYTGGAGTEAAIAGGATLVRSLSEGLSSADKPEPNTPFSPPTTLSSCSPQPPQSFSLGENVYQIRSEKETIEAWQPPSIWVPADTPSLIVSLPKETPIAESQTFKSPYYPLPDLENLYGEGYVSDLYTRFGLPDPYGSSWLGSNQSPPPAQLPIASSESIPRLSPTQPFVEQIQNKLGEVKDPRYVDQFPMWNSTQPSSKIEQNSLGSIEESLSQASSQLKGQEDASFWGKAKEFGPAVVHEALDGVLELASFIPELLEEIKDVGVRLLPESLLQDAHGLEITPMENFEASVAAVHETIDRLFSTNQAGSYTPEAKEAQDIFAIGILPPPGQLSADTKKLTEALRAIAGLESGAKITEVFQLEKRISEWLGEGTQLIRNKAGDPVFLSKDGSRKLRFDFNKPAPHESPHLHLEQLVNGEWQEIDRIYPIDIPHK